MNTYDIGSLTAMMAMSNISAEKKEDKAAMNLAFTLRLQGEIDVSKLERAISRLVSEDIMNTYLTMSENGIKAHEKEYSGFSLSCESVQGESLQEKIKKVKELTEAAALEPLPLEDPEKKQYCFKLYELDKDYHVLFMMVHHAFLDFGAVMIAIAHIFSYYNDEKYEYPFSLPFKDFMKDELEYMQTEDAKEEEAYWEKETADLKQPVLTPEAPDDGEDITEQDLISIFSKKELEAIAAKERTSSFNLLTLMIHMAIAKVNDCNDTMLQYAISNRSEPDHRFTLGCLTRVLFNRIEFEPDMTSSEMNKLMRKKLGAGYQNRHVAGKSNIGEVSYIAVNEDMNDLNLLPLFNGKPVQPEFVDLPRELNFIATLILPLGGDELGVGVLTDMTKYARHSKELIKAITLAKRFITEYPDRPFSDFMRSDITLDTLDCLCDEDYVEIIEL